MIKRTSITLAPAIVILAEQNVARSGFRSLSAYIEHLIRTDAQHHAAHVDQEIADFEKAITELEETHKGNPDGGWYSSNPEADRADFKSRRNHLQNLLAELKRAKHTYLTRGQVDPEPSPLSAPYALNETPPSPPKRGRKTIRPDEKN